jgi:hypothetical protein
MTLGSAGVPAVEDAAARHHVRGAVPPTCRRWAPRCFAAIMASFLEQPSQRGEDSCVSTLAVPPFEIT